MVLRVGVAGVGVMGSEHARNLATAISGARLEALSDADQTRAAAIAAELGGPRVHAQALDLIDDKMIDAVVIASPEHTHAALVLACLQAGKPVLCEKPLAADVSECLKVVEAEVALGRRLIQVGFMRRFEPGYRIMKQAIMDERYGIPLLLHCAHRNAEAPSFLNKDEMLITSAAVHEIDITRWLLGHEIVRATVMLPRPANDRGLHDPQMLLLETAGGVVVDVEIFMNARFGSEVDAELVCAFGTISLAPPAAALLRHDGRSGTAVPLAWMPRFATAYRLELQAWVNAAAKGSVDADGASAWDGYAASAVADACVVALKGRVPVSVTLESRPELYM